jgi:Na+/alanine symporter
MVSCLTKSTSKFVCVCVCVCVCVYVCMCVCVCVCVCQQVPAAELNRFYGALARRL